MEKNFLIEYYIQRKMSVSDIAKTLNRSETGINYWIRKHKIKKRSIGEAIYLKNNPSGDPFDVKKPNNLYLAELKGFGLGLYWGEGNRKNKHSIKLANTDPKLIKKFIEFLELILGVKRENIKFSLQIFSDIDPIKAKAYWIDELKINPCQFYEKVTVTRTGKVGNYKNKNENGVLTVYYHNIKLRNILMDMLPL